MPEVVSVSALSDGHRRVLLIELWAVAHTPSLVGRLRGLRARRATRPTTCADHVIARGRTRSAETGGSRRWPTPSAFMCKGYFASVPRTARRSPVPNTSFSWARHRGWRCLPILTCGCCFGVWRALVRVLTFLTGAADPTGFAAPAVPAGRVGRDHANRARGPLVAGDLHRHHSCRADAEGRVHDDRRGDLPVPPAGRGRRVGIV